MCSVKADYWSPCPILTEGESHKSRKNSRTETLLPHDVFSLQGLRKHHKITHEAPDWILPGSWLVHLDEKVGDPGKAIALYHTKERGGELVLGGEDHVGVQAEDVGRGDKMEQLGPRLLMFTNIIGIE